MEEEIFAFETSMDSFLRSNANFTSTEQESALLHQQDVEVDDDEKETTTTTQQAAVRKELVSPRRSSSSEGRKLGQPSSTNYLIGAGLYDAINFLKRELFPCVLCRICCCLFFCSLYFCLPCLSYFPRFAHKNCRSRYERRNELSGCAGCVNCGNRRRAFTHRDFSPMKGILCVLEYLSVFSLK